MKGKIQLERVPLAEAERLWQMQKAAFGELLARYQDRDTNPACETLECVRDKITRPDSAFYWIKRGDTPVGAIRVVLRENESKRISPLFVLPQYRNRGIAQQAITAAEKLYGDKDWTLGTILQEPGNCHLYEKMGYRPAEEAKEINEKMTLIFYQK